MKGGVFMLVITELLQEGSVNRVVILYQEETACLYTRF